MRPARCAAAGVVVLRWDGRRRNTKGGGYSRSIQPGPLTPPHNHSSTTYLPPCPHRVKSNIASPADFYASLCTVMYKYQCTSHRPPHMQEQQTEQHPPIRLHRINPLPVPPRPQHHPSITPSLPLQPNPIRQQQHPPSHHITPQDSQHLTLTAPSPHHAPHPHPRPRHPSPAQPSQ